MELIEIKRLDELEQQIETDKKAFYRIGMALLEIRDSRLYREQHATFEDYCRERWELGRNYANKMISSASVVKLLGTNVPMQPANEAQARPLTKLETPELQQAAWKQVVETAPEGVITARHVSKVVNIIRKEGVKQKIKEKVAVKHETVNKIELIDEPFKGAFDKFYWEVKRARLEGWKTTSKEVALHLVSLLQDLIEVN